MAMNDRRDPHPRISRPTEHLDHPAPRVQVAPLPLVEFHHHRLPRLRRGLAQQIDDAPHPRIIHLHPTPPALVAQHADQAPAAPLDHPLHPRRHRRLVICIPAPPVPPWVPPLHQAHQHPVALQRRAGVPPRNENPVQLLQVQPRLAALLRRPVGTEPRMPLALESQPADQPHARRVRPLVAPLAPRYQHPLPLQPGQFRPQQAPVPRCHLQFPRQLRLVHRPVRRRLRQLHQPCPQPFRFHPPHGERPPSFHNPQSTIRHPQSAIRNPQSYNPQSTIRNPQSVTRNPDPHIHQSTILDPPSAIRNPLPPPQSTIPQLSICHPPWHTNTVTTM